MHCLNITTRANSLWRRAIMLFSTFAVLALSACAAGNIGSPRATPTPGPITPVHGLLFAINSNQVGSGSPHTDVYALGLSGGKQVWHQQITDQVFGRLLGGGRLYLETEKEGTPGTPPTASTLQAWNANTGAPLWRVGRSSGTQTPIAATSDTVFVTTASYANNNFSDVTVGLSALRASDGKLLWTAPLDQRLIYYTLLGDGVLYFVTAPTVLIGDSEGNQGILTAVATSNGAPLWHTMLQGDVGASPPVLSNGVIYLSANGYSINSTSHVLAVRASDGVVLWRKASPPSDYIFPMVVTDQTVYFSYEGCSALSGQSCTPSVGIVALRAADGSPLWQVTPYFGGAPIAGDGGAIYALGLVDSQQRSTPTLDSFDAISGKALFSQPLPTLPIQLQSEFSELQGANGVLYSVGSGVATFSATPSAQLPHAAVVLALSAHDGSVVWQRQFTGGVESHLLIAP